MSTATRTSRAHVGNDSYAAPRQRDRHIDTRAVVCPACSAAAGDTCVTSAGKPTKCHPTRRRLAIKRMWESGEMGRATDLPLPAAHKMRGARGALGLSRRALAEQIGVPEHAVAGVEKGHVVTGDAATAIAEWFARVTGQKT